MRRFGPCRACGAKMLWAKMTSGAFNPLNPEEVEPAELKDGELVPKRGIVAFNPESGGGIMVSKENLADVLVWREQGRVTTHTSHFSDCPERGRFRRERDREGVG